MGDVFGKLIDWIKSPKQSAIVFITTLALVLLPPGWIAYLRLQPFDRYRSWAVLVCFLSGAAIVVQSTIWIWNYLGAAKERRIAIKEREQYLHALTPGEKHILSAYIAGQTETQYLDIQNGVVGALFHKGLLYQGSAVGRLTYFALNIQPWVRVYLVAHPELLDGAQLPLKPPSARGRYIPRTTPPNDSY